ncbi:hypothetical protein [Halocatena pleomorpha]|uniref:hypothetical protein n=1 Tax=Halocatena pleomorpha TaxID=1785090 RepID=UPI00163A374B|nr:hypothetical protein [Halocatena pleomorpha]
MATERVSDGFLRVLLIVIGAIVLIPILMIFIAPMMGMMGWWGAMGWQVVSPQFGEVE